MRRLQGYCWRLRHWSPSGCSSRHRDKVGVLAPAPGPGVLMVLEVRVVVSAEALEFVRLFEPS